MSPDLEPVPEGFTLSPCGDHLLRPNGKPVPRGVHVGPGFRLLKPTGEALPDGAAAQKHLLPGWTEGACMALHCIGSKDTFRARWQQQQ